ncbi:hypothetical protein AXF42_Ash008753 [Apostasia shenzhenica]|uniref:MalT-like TPR region domain-containing protein n=1 Tax=Apostasia shenzhenica TaxID=1088818 RepID=A0A2I0B294_9ASPA|nr:hypothetical protein AXF42_Ash008753 [Apostasia shenzhenica]
MLRLFAKREASRALCYSQKPISIVVPTVGYRSSNKVALAMRSFGTIVEDETHCKNVARQMIQYALGFARSQKSGEKYSQALMILEQGINNLHVGNSTDSTAMLLLAMSTLLYESGDLQDAMEKLKMVHQLDNASLALKVAAWEGLIGLNLETGQDITSSVLANDCFQLLNTSSEGNSSSLNVLLSRAKAMQGLTQLALGQLESGNTTLCQGELSHATGNLSLAKDLYQKVINLHEKEDVSGNSFLPSANMISEEVLLGATCALGQLFSLSGNFSEAEEMLTKALTKAESHFGSPHPKIGVILTCIAMMYKRKAKLEASSSILIQEGLYRRALDMLKAPALDSEDSDRQLGKRDVIALARGGYAEILCIQQNRKEEGDRMKKWAEAAWRNRRMSLADALEISEPNKPAVIDTRICRVL